MASMASLMVSLPEASMAAAAASLPLVLMPASMMLMLMRPVESAPPILLTSGWMENVMDSERRPSFHWPYSMVSARNMSISSWMKAWPTNMRMAASAMRTMECSAKKNTA